MTRRVGTTITRNPAVKYVGKDAPNFSHEYRPTRQGTCDECARRMRVAAHGYVETVR